MMLHDCTHIENWNRTRRLQKAACEGVGPWSGKVIVSRTRFAWILIHRFAYQFTPNV